jgi:hypothetical protein
MMRAYYEQQFLLVVQEEDSRQHLQEMYADAPLEEHAQIAATIVQQICIISPSSSAHKSRASSISSINKFQRVHNICLVHTCCYT